MAPKRARASNARGFGGTADNCTRRYPEPVATAAYTPEREIVILPPRRWEGFALRELWSYRELLYFLTKREGLGYGDGKILLQQADTTLVALDANTGKVVWTAKNGDPKIGETNTNAPHVFNDKVITGISGGATFAVALKVAEQAKQGSLMLAMLPDTGERYLTTPLFEGIAEDMNEEELAIMRSTPGYQLG